MQLISISRAIAEGEALIYVFGQRWGPETQRDKIFGFSPGNGVHDIHMNQGNSGASSATTAYGRMAHRCWLSPPQTSG